VPASDLLAGQLRELPRPGENMNANRRREIENIQIKLEELAGDASTIQTELEDLKDKLEEIKEEEQEYFDNMPESLQGGDKGDAASASIENLENAVGMIEDAATSAEGLADNIENAIAEMGNAL
jgi:chromosome segregation ATPase